MDIEETDCNEQFIRDVLPSLDWSGVLVAASAIDMNDMPAEFDAKLLEDAGFIQAMHNMLIDVHILKGKLICPESGRIFEIDNGVPIMM